MIIYTQRACGALYRFIMLNPMGCYILPANVCPVVPLTILKAGRSVEFVDISSQTLCMDKDACLSKIAKEDNCYVGVIFVQTYGVNYDTSEFCNSLKALKPDILFVEDRCLCIPNFNTISSDVDLYLYSTGYAKYVELGYGGFAISTKQNIMSNENLKYSTKDCEEFEVLYKKSFNEKTIIEDISKLYWLDISVIDKNTNYESSLIEKKRIIDKHKLEINNLYQTLLPQSIQLDSRFQTWRFNIILPNSDYVIQKIFSNGLFASKHYQTSAYLFDNSTKYHVADDLYRNIINLFNDLHFTLSQAERICKIINTNI